MHLPNKAALGVALLTLFCHSGTGWTAEKMAAVSSAPAAVPVEQAKKADVQANAVVAHSAALAAIKVEPVKTPQPPPVQTAVPTQVVMIPADDRNPATTIGLDGSLKWVVVSKGSVKTKVNLITGEVEISGYAKPVKPAIGSALWRSAVESALTDMRRGMNHLIKSKASPVVVRNLETAYKTLSDIRQRVTDPRETKK